MAAAQPLSAAVDKFASGVSDDIGTLLRDAVPAVAPALALSVWHSGAPWYEASAGWVDPEERTTPVGYATRFDLGTLSEVFTATAFLRLAADGKLELDGPVVQTVPELDPSAISYRQLLTHTAGLAPRLDAWRDVGPPPPPPGAADPTSLDARWEAALLAIGHDRLVERPGTVAHPSDLGLVLLGVAVARRFGAPLSDAMQALIRDRLGLDTLGYRPLDRGRPRTSAAPTGIDDRWRGRRCWGEVEDEDAAALGGVAGHAGLFASAHDVARFGVAWLRRDARLRLERFFGSAVTDQSGIGAGRGFGWVVQPCAWLEGFAVGAYGQAGSVGTSLVVDPERDLVVALLTNAHYAGHTTEGIERLRRELHGVIASAFGPGR